MIPVAKPSIVLNELKYLKECVETEQITKGRFIGEFEKEFAKYIGTSYAVTVVNGTSALHLALLSHNINSGEVIVPDLTFVATGNAVLSAGAKPVFCDVDKDSWTIDVNKIEALITNKTKAIIPVHLFGLSCEMKEINELARKYGLVVIEDSAEALGAEYYGNKVGSLGDSSIFSFFGSKIITTGEGGMITTNNKEVFERAKHLKEFAMAKKDYFHSEHGFNYKLSNLQCAFGLAQLEGVKELLEKRAKLVERYFKEIEMKTQLVKPYMKHANWMYGVLAESKADCLLLQRELKEKGIETRPFFYPLSKLPYNSKASCPVSLDLSQRGFCIPTFSGITKEQTDKVITEVNAINNNHKERENDK